MWSDWTAGGVMTLFEEYNGLDYAAMGVLSAYVWSGTDQYFTFELSERLMYFFQSEGVAAGSWFFA